MNDVQAYESALESMTLKTQMGAKGIEECTPETFTEFIFEVIAKSNLIIALLYPEYTNSLFDFTGYNYVYLCSRIEDVFNDVTSTIIQDEYVLSYMDILYSVDENMLEACYEELKRFSHNNFKEMTPIEVAMYDKMAKDIAVYLQQCGYFNRPIVSNIYLGKI